MVTEDIWGVGREGLAIIEPGKEKSLSLAKKDMERHSSFLTKILPLTFNREVLAKPSQHCAHLLKFDAS